MFVPRTLRPNQSINKCKLLYLLEVKIIENYSRLSGVPTWETIIHWEYRSEFPINKKPLISFYCSLKKSGILVLKVSLCAVTFLRNRATVTALLLQRQHILVIRQRPGERVNGHIKSLPSFMN